MPHRLPIVERGGWEMSAQRLAAAVIVTRRCKKKDLLGTGSGILHVVCSVLSAADMKLKASIYLLLLYIILPLLIN